MEETKPLPAKTSWFVKSTPPQLVLRALGSGLGRRGIAAPASHLPGPAPPPAHPGPRVGRGSHWRPRGKGQTCGGRSSPPRLLPAPLPSSVPALARPRVPTCGAALGQPGQQIFTLSKAGSAPKPKKATAPPLPASDGSQRGSDSIGPASQAALPSLRTFVFPRATPRGGISTLQPQEAAEDPPSSQPALHLASLNTSRAKPWGFRGSATPRQFSPGRLIPDHGPARMLQKCGRSVHA